MLFLTALEQPASAINWFESLLRVPRARVRHKVQPRYYSDMIPTPSDLGFGILFLSVLSWAASSGLCQIAWRSTVVAVGIGAADLIFSVAWPIGLYFLASAFFAALDNMPSNAMARFRLQSGAAPENPAMARLGPGYFAGFPRLLAN